MVTRFIDNETAFYKCFKMTIPFPSFWEMDKWDSENSPRPQEVEIRIRDLLELIADQCINPKIQLLWKEHVHINCYQKTNEKGEKVFSDIMSSPWAHNEQKKIEKINPKGLIVPVLFYWDEVHAGMNQKAHMAPVMFTLGYYDEPLRKQDFSKEVRVFLDGLLNTLDESLIKHLNEVKGFCKTKCEEIVKYFKKQVFFKFWELVLDSIKAVSNRGILVKILGHEEPKLLFPRIAFHIGDDPAQHDVAAIKCSGNVKHGCIRCIYNSREGNEYNRNRDTLRNISVVEQIEVCAKIYQKKLTGLKNTKAEEDLLDDLEDKGYHPIINPFSNAPFGENNHIYNTPTDVMHLFSCDNNTGSVDGLKLTNGFILGSLNLTVLSGINSLSLNGVVGGFDNFIICSISSVSSPCSDINCPNNALLTGSFITSIFGFLMRSTLTLSKSFAFVSGSSVDKF
jgi:hypothetical protein